MSEPTVRRRRGHGGRRTRGSYRAALTVALGLTTLGAAGCGGSHAPTTTTGAPAPGTTTMTSTSTSTTTAPRRARRRRHAAGVVGPAVGSRQGVHIDGTYLTVRVLRVLTLVDTGSPAFAGTRQVGVQVVIANQAGATYDSTASGDFSLVLSSGQSTPLDIRLGPCATPLVDFESHVYPGDVRPGCVAFSVPRSARVLGVRFSPFSRPTGTLTWRTGR